MGQNTVTDDGTDGQDGPKDEIVEEMASNVNSRGVVQRRFPWIMAVSLAIGPIAWFGPAGAGRNTLVPQVFADIDPSGKAAAVSSLAVLATIVGAVANFLFGALSDTTRTRIGKRTPWVIAGGIIMSVALVLVGHATSVAGVFVAWAFVAAAENMIAAPMIAQMSDRVAPTWRGRVSSGYALGFVVAQNFALVATPFLSNPTLGLNVMAAINIGLTVIHVILMREGSNLDEPKVKFDKQAVKQYFLLPTEDAGDFYLALFGKFMMTTGATMITTFQLYVFTDYIDVSDSEAAVGIATMSTIMLVLGVIFALAGGLIADRFKRLKLPVGLSTALVGLGAMFPFIFQTPWSMFAYAVCVGIGNGLYNSVDNALNIAVLPHSENAGKDLGVINLANTLSQALAAAVAGAIVVSIGYHPLFPIAFLINLLGAVLFFLIKRVR